MQSVKNTIAPPASSYILQDANQHAFLGVVTHNPQISGRYITSSELLREHTNDVLRPNCMQQYVL